MQSQQSSTSRKLCRYCVNLSEIPDIRPSGLKSKERIRGAFIHPLATKLRRWHLWKWATPKLKFLELADTCIVKKIVNTGVIDPAESKFVLGLRLLLHSHFWLFFAENFESFSWSSGSNYWTNEWIGAPSTSGYLFPISEVKTSCFQLSNL